MFVLGKVYKIDSFLLIMKKGGDKKGLSTVVSTLMIILLVVVSIGIVWFTINNLIKEETSGISAGLNRVILDIAEESVKVNSPGIAPSLSLKVGRNSEEGDLAKIKFILSDGNREQVTDLPANLGKLESARFDIPLQDINFVKKVSVAPILLKDNGEEYTGQVTDSYELSNEEILSNFLTVQPISWWKFDGDAKDSVGSNNGELKNDVEFTTGKDGKAISFDGVNDYVSVLDADSLDVIVGFYTLALWVKFPISGSAPYAGIVSKNYSASALAGSWGLVRNLTSANSIKYQDSSNADNFNVNLAVSGISNGWHHIAIVRNGGGTTIYLDGKNVSSQHESSPSPLFNSAPLLIGQANNAYSKTDVDELMFFDKALTSKDISVLYGANSD